MSLSGALNVGRSALAAQQAALQITGNNIANAGTDGYTRQTAPLTPSKDQQVKQGLFIGTGVDLRSSQRQIDEALQQRLRASVSDEQAAGTNEQWLGRIESVFNELGDDDLSTRLSTFFTSWSNLANKPEDVGLRQIVLQNGESTAKWLNDLRGQFEGLRTDVAARLDSQVKDADSLASQVADLNRQIVVAESGGRATANALRDQRDAVVQKLSEQIELRSVVQENGVMNLYVGSEALVTNSDSRGIGARREVVDGVLTSTVTIKATGAPVKLNGGELAGLQQAQQNVADVIDNVDAIAGQLIFDLNKLHSAGQGLTGQSSLTATNKVNDTAAALNSKEAGLPFAANNGSFVVHVKQKATGLVTSTLVQVDLDGNGTETSLASLAGDLNAIGGVAASVTTGKLTVAAESDAVEFSFSQDSSGALASLGIGGFFTGKTAADIAVDPALKANPVRLAASKNGEKTDNGTARAIATLESQPLAGLGGISLKDKYQALVNGVGVQASDARTNSEAARVVNETLSTQREALSGVSMDEEAINLMRYQRAFQGAARLISVVDEMMQTVLGLVR